MKLFSFIAMLAFTSVSFADGFKTKEETRQFSDLLIDKFIAKKFTEGLNLSKKYWPLPKVEIDGLANQITQQWPIVDQRFGEAIGKEFVKQEVIGQSFIRYFYLHKFENHSIYWNISFYKPKDKWVINTIMFLDAVEDLYE